MERERITCPETAHLEEIDVEHTPFGRVVAGCSRFEPRSEVTCERECTRRLDRRDRTDDDCERVLVVLARAAWTLSFASALADELARDRLVVELADADTHGAPPPHDYDAVIVAAPDHLGWRARAIVDYVAQHRDALAAMPTFWFAIGRTGRASSDRWGRVAGWHPTHSFGIARPGWRVRWLREPDAQGAPRIREIARAIAEQIPARELASP